MRSTFFYEFSNYGSYEKLTNDGLTQWHPAFLQLGATLEDCAQKYRRFCNRYKPKSKPVKRFHWGSRLLAKLKVEPLPRRSKSKEKNSPFAPLGCQVSESPEVSRVVRQFIEANLAPWLSSKQN